jgi:Protein of unknown function (DUF3800)
MSWTLFLDESGQDRRNSPYEVLAGLAVRDRQIWPLIRDLSDAQEMFFGMRLFEAYGSEAKAKRLLKARVFRDAAALPPIPEPERTRLARELLIDGTSITRERLAALCQAKIEYTLFSLQLARKFGARAFASIIPREAPRPESRDSLRKDYAFLFERFYHFLDSDPGEEMGYLVFDELERSQCHLLLTQVSRYFLRTQNGRARSRRIIPEPFFVHSDLTTLVQVADLIAYTIAWGVRIPGMDAPARGELNAHAEEVKQLRYFAEADSGEQIWGFKLIPDLRPAHA